MKTKSITKITLIALLVISIFTSCNSTGKGKSEDTLGSTSENGSYIDFYNAFIDLHKEIQDKMEDISEWSTEKFPNDKTVYQPAFNYLGMDYDKNKKILEGGLTVKVDQQDEINKNIKIYLAAIQTVTTKLEEFKLYKTAEDHKADNWKKGDELVDSIKIACENFFKAKEAVTPMMTALADKAEAEFIAKDPDKDYIFALKKSMKNLDIFYEALVLASEGKDKTKVEPAYNELEKSLSELKLHDAEKLKNVTRKIYYGNYVKQFEEALAVCRKANNNIKDGSADYESLGNNIDGKYNTLIGTYNNFIN